MGGPAGGAPRPPPRAAAARLHRRALAGRKARLGPAHPATLSSVYDQGLLLQKQGHLAAAGRLPIDVPGIEAGVTVVRRTHVDALRAAVRRLEGM